MNEWREFYKKNKPDHLPAAPNIVYKKSGWNGFGDFFGNGVIAHYKKKYRDFKEAREYARSLSLKSVADWREYCKSGKIPNDISSSPHNTYKNEGWISYGDWLGTGRVADGQKIWASFDQVKMFVKNNNIKTKDEWVNFKNQNKLPENIPSSPDGVYKRSNEWISWTDFLGNDHCYMSFEEAKKWVKERGIKTSREYKIHKRPKSLPLAPDNVIQWRDFWKGWADFLGKE